MATSASGTFTAAGASALVTVYPGQFVDLTLSGTYAGLKVVVERGTSLNVWDKVNEYAVDTTATLYANDINEPTNYRLRALVTDPEEEEDEITYTLTARAMTISETKDRFGNTVATVGDDRIAIELPLELPVYTVATQPDATEFAGCIAYFSDGDAGSACIAVSLGSAIAAE